MATSSKKNTKKEDQLYAGIAFALAEVWRLHQEDIVIRDVLQGSGITIEDLKNSGADPYDWKEVRDAVAPLGYTG